jgi:hypothetical protein
VLHRKRQYGSHSRPEANDDLADSLYKPSSDKSQPVEQLWAMFRHSSRVTMSQLLEEQPHNKPNQHPYDERCNEGSPTRMHPRQMTLGMVILTSFILIVYTGFSLFINENIWLSSSVKQVAWNLLATTPGSKLKFGLWSICTPRFVLCCTQISCIAPLTLVVFHILPLASATTFHECYGPRSGYSLEDSVNVTVYLGRPNIVNAAAREKPSIFIIHPVCSVSAFLVLLICLGLHYFTMSTFTLIATIVSSLLSTVALGADLALVAVVQVKLRVATNGTSQQII